MPPLDRDNVQRHTFAASDVEQWIDTRDFSAPDLPSRLDMWEDWEI